jgi:hypothetical protein
MNKKALGGLVMLGGIAFIGFIWFKKNKPNISNKQLEYLTSQSNNLNAGANNIDKPFDYGY